MRNFIIFYVGKENPVKEGQVYGNSAISRPNYPNLSETVREFKRLGGLSACAITNIIELSKADFDEFKR